MKKVSFVFDQGVETMDQSVDMTPKLKKNISFDFIGDPEAVLSGFTFDYCNCDHHIEELKADLTVTRSGGSNAVKVTASRRMTDHNAHKSTARVEATVIWPFTINNNGE